MVTGPIVGTGLPDAASGPPGGAGDRSTAPRALAVAVLWSSTILSFSTPPPSKRKTSLTASRRPFGRATVATANSTPGGAPSFALLRAPTLVAASTSAVLPSTMRSPPAVLPGEPLPARLSCTATTPALERTAGSTSITTRHAAAGRRHREGLGLARRIESSSGARWEPRAGAYASDVTRQPAL